MICGKYQADQFRAQPVVARPVGAGRRSVGGRFSGWCCHVRCVSDCQAADCDYGGVVVEVSVNVGHQVVLEMVQE